jgi:hypothetical protein
MCCDQLLFTCLKCSKLYIPQCRHFSAPVYNLVYLPYTITEIPLFHHVVPIVSLIRICRTTRCTLVDIFLSSVDALLCAKDSKEEEVALESAALYRSKSGRGTAFIADSTLLPSACTGGMMAIPNCA